VRISQDCILLSDRDRRDEIEVKSLLLVRFKGGFIDCINKRAEGNVIAAGIRDEH
jgi:hypothetical protein